MVSQEFDIVGIGNAIVDVITDVNDEFINQQELRKGLMSLVDLDTIKSLSNKIEIKANVSGGSVANSIVALAQNNIKSAFIGKVGKDEVGNSFIRGLEKEKVVFIENNQTPRILALTKNVYDPLSIAFAYRFYPSNSHKNKTFPVCDGKKFLNVRLNAGEKAKIEVPYGIFWANDVVPDMKNLSGVFKKSPKGILRVWYSADKRRIPLKISSEVVVGRFTAQLIRARGLKEN